MKTNYSMQMDTFIFRRTWGEALKDLTDAEAGQLIKAVCAFTDGEFTEFEDGSLNTLYKMITGQLNYSAKRYMKKVERYSADEGDYGQ